MIVIHIRFDNNADRWTVRTPDGAPRGPADAVRHASSPSTAPPFRHATRCAACRAVPCAPGPILRPRRIGNGTAKRMRANERGRQLLVLVVTLSGGSREKEPGTHQRMCIGCRSRFWTCVSIGLTHHDWSIRGYLVDDCSGWFWRASCCEVGTLCPVWVLYWTVAGRGRIVTEEIMFEDASHVRHRAATTRRYWCGHGGGAP